METLTRDRFLAPPTSEIHKAQFKWRCWECKEEEPAGATFAWQHRPHRMDNQRDHQVHLEHWHDVAWELANTPPTMYADLELLDEQEPEPVRRRTKKAAKPTTGNNIRWAVRQLKLGKEVRRDHWHYEKRLVMEIEFDLQIVHVITKDADHVYTWPACDTRDDAANWELY